jgi:hypothetical protein
MNNKNKQLKNTQFTIQEIWMAMRKSKKEYTRKTKHKK